MGCSWNNSIQIYGSLQTKLGRDMEGHYQIQVGVISCRCFRSFEPAILQHENGIQGSQTVLSEDTFIDEVNRETRIKVLNGNENGNSKNPLKFTGSFQTFLGYPKSLAQLCHSVAVQPAFVAVKRSNFCRVNSCRLLLKSLLLVPSTCSHEWTVFTKKTDTSVDSITFQYWLVVYLPL